MLLQPIFELSGSGPVRDLVRRHPWATLVSQTPGGPVVSHLPVLLDATAGVTVVGHLAASDADAHELGERDAVLIVAGPHGYVSPSFYRSGAPAVPTWNFVVAHLHGRPERLDAEQTFAVLERTVDAVEHPRPEPFRLDAVVGYARRIAPYTAGFRLTAERVLAKAKLSQDKSDVDRRGVLDGLEHDPVHRNPELAGWMRELGVAG